MALEKDLDKMVEEGVISFETSRSIRNWYEQQQPSDNRRLTLLFGVLGVLLVVSGIMLVLAHNWDSFPLTVKTVWAFLPLVVGQVGVGYVLLKKRDKEWWREISATWLALSIGGCIALISQIYHLPGELPDFLLTWLLLGAALIYLLPSQVVAVLFLAGSVWYATEAGYGYNSSLYAGYYFWGLLLWVLPFYRSLWVKKKDGFFARLFHFGFPAALLIGLGMHIGNSGYGWMWIAYASLLSIFYMLGTFIKSHSDHKISNGYYYSGMLGSLLLLFIGSFVDFRKELLREKSLLIIDGGQLALVLAIILFLLALSGFIYLFGVKKFTPFKPLAFSFVLFAAMIWMAHLSNGSAAIPANLYILGLGVWVLVEGSRQKSFFRINAGLGLIAILAICRFFDTELSFVLRGLIFITVGIGFALANYQMIQKKKTHA